MNLRTLAWKNLLRRKPRAVFTGLGIFLGIATFVAISSITSQMEGAVQDQLDRFGANIVVSPRTEQLSMGSETSPSGERRWRTPASRWPTGSGSRRSTTRTGSAPSSPS
jgi:ABC-type lipoprotein release transport system permease subunit